MKTTTTNLLRANRLRLPTARSDRLSRLMRSLQPIAHATSTCNTSLPRRVLEMKGRHVYLQETPSIRAAYACLSHCWGVNGASLQLTSASLAQFKGGLEMQQLPKTFRDAVAICSKQTISYHLDRCTLYVIFQFKSRRKSSDWCRYNTRRQTRLGRGCGNDVKHIRICFHHNRCYMV